MKAKCATLKILLTTSKMLLTTLTNFYQKTSTSYYLRLSAFTNGASEAQVIVKPLERCYKVENRTWALCCLARTEKRFVRGEGGAENFLLRLFTLLWKPKAFNLERNYWVVNKKVCVFAYLDVGYFHLLRAFTMASLLKKYTKGRKLNESCLICVREIKCLWKAWLSSC